jgi:hypothetical protein
MHMFGHRANLYANKNNESFVTDFSPGQPGDSGIRVRRAQATKLTKLDLHDSFLSGGVQVALA